jgi:demethylmenaquinone methyltransferase/2-methoxy-6-polyprenyl-1,4-benzoquinol methylase
LGATRLAGLRATDVVVDVACGTGDLTIEFASRLSWLNAKGGRKTVDLQAIGIDFTMPMLPIARQKFLRAIANDEEEDGELDELRKSAKWINGDAQALPLPDASADVVSIAFGIRNVQDVKAALREFHRVLRPGGRVIILEFSRPTNPMIRFFNDVYCSKIMPHTATWISGDKSGAYKYLPKSVESFIDREQMMEMMREAGFTQVEPFPMTFGVCVCYRGVKE